MGLSKELSRRLPICFYHCFQCRSLHWVVLVGYVNAEISKGMENVDGFDCFYTALLVAKDQIDPVMQVSRHLGTLERLAMNKYKQTTVISTPRRQRDMMHQFSVLALAKIKVLVV